MTAIAPLRRLFMPTAMTESLSVYLPATVAFRVINFARLALMTWWMTQAEFGFFNLVLLLSNVATPLVSLGLNDAITRFVPIHEQDGTLRRFIVRSGILLAAATTLLTAGMLALAILTGGAFQPFSETGDVTATAERAQNLTLLSISAAVAVMQAMHFFLLGVLKGLRSYKAVAWMEVTQGVAFLLLALASAVLGWQSAAAMAACYLISLALTFVIYATGLSLVLPPDSNAASPPASPLLRRLLQFSICIMTATAAWQLFQYYPTWRLNQTHGADSVALFSAVRQVGQFILAGAVAFVTIVQTQVARTWETRGPEAAGRQFSLVLRVTSLTLLFMCGALAAGRHLIMRIYARGYSVGADVLPLQLLFFLMAGYLTFLSVHFQLIKRTRWTPWPWVVGLAANIILTRVVTFEEPLGLWAASWAAVLAMAAALTACLLMVRLERRPVERGVYFCMAAAWALALPTWAMGGVLVTLALLAAFTNLIFTHDERAEVGSKLWLAVQRFSTGRF